MSSALQRRRFVQSAGALASLGVVAWPAAAKPLDLLDVKSFADALASLGGVPQPSDAIQLELPAIAEDGALVPLTVSSTLPGTREIVILVDVNPQPVAARFAIPAGTEAYVATRIRMARSGTVLVAVRTDAGVFSKAVPAQVIAGGCG